MHMAISVKICENIIYFIDADVDTHLERDDNAASTSPSLNKFNIIYICI